VEPRWHRSVAAMARPRESESRFCTRIGATRCTSAVVRCFKVWAPRTRTDAYAWSSPYFFQARGKRGECLLMWGHLIVFDILKSVLRNAVHVRYVGRVSFLFFCFCFCFFTCGRAAVKRRVQSYMSSRLWIVGLRNCLGQRRLGR